MEERIINVDAPKISSICNGCPANINGGCAIALLEKDLGRSPTIAEIMTEDIEPQDIPLLFCPNGYTNSSNSRIF